jgi:hypothetical protein
MRSRIYRDGVTGITSRLWVRGAVFPIYKFTSRQVWGKNKKIQGGKDRRPIWHAPDEPEDFEAEGYARRVRRTKGGREGLAGVCQSNRLEQIECEEGCTVNRKLADQVWDDFEVRHQGRLGWGLYAMKGYEEGGVICGYTGRVLNDKQMWDIMAGKQSGDALYILSFKDVEGMHVDAEAEGGPGRFAQHTCVDPTAEFTTWWTNGTPHNTLVARRRIAAGDEITLSYHMEEGGMHKTTCACGHRLCQGYLGGTVKEGKRPRVTGGRGLSALMVAATMATVDSGRERVTYSPDPNACVRAARGLPQEEEDQCAGEALETKRRKVRGGGTIDGQGSVADGREREMMTRGRGMARRGVSRKGRARTDGQGSGGWDEGWDKEEVGTGWFGGGERGTRERWKPTVARRHRQESRTAFRWGHWADRSAHEELAERTGTEWGGLRGRDGLFQAVSEAQGTSLTGMGVREIRSRLREDMSRRETSGRTEYERESGMGWDEYLSAVGTTAWADEAMVRHLAQMAGREICIWLAGKEAPRVFGPGSGPRMHLAWTHHGG